MSVKVSSWVWHEVAGVNGNELILLLALADVADDSGRCRFVDDESALTYSALAEKGRVSKSTVIRIIAGLRERGLIEQVKGVKSRPNEFRVLVPWAERSGSNLTPNGVAGVADSVSTAQDSVSTATEFGVNDDSRSSLKRIDVIDVSTSGVQTVGVRFAQPLCDVLIAELIRNEVKVPEQVSKRWLDAARLMVDADGRDPHQAKALIEWACRDAFWRSNILSMPKFREKFDALRLARDRAPGRRSTVENSREAAQILEDRRAQRDLQAVGS